MDPYQNGNLLTMTSRGSTGGEPRVDGSALEQGIHLRWQTAPELGFPPGGFDLYRRRENNGHYWRCGSFREADVVGVAWVPADDDHVRPGVAFEFSGVVRITRGCDDQDRTAARFPGDREIRISFGAPVRIVRITFDSDTPANPIGEAIRETPSGPVTVAREPAHKRGKVRVLTVHADGFDHLVLRGRDMMLCELCFVLLREGKDLFWPQNPLNGATPIYLPITHPVWGSPHNHPGDDQAEAEARLPAGLPEERRQAYADGFRDDLHGLLYDLVGTDPQRLHRIQHNDAESAASLDWPGVSLIQLMALDPNLARELGLYWHDEPPSTSTFYDYRVVAHYDDTPYPGRRITFGDLEPGRRIGTTLERRGLRVASANPLEGARVNWAGSEQAAVHVSRHIPAGPITITVAEAVPSISVHLVSEGAVTAKACHGTAVVSLQVRPPGELSLQFDDVAGIDQILLFPLGDVDVVEVVLRRQIGGLGDVTYDVFHVRANESRRALGPTLEPASVVRTPTGLDELGQLLSAQSRVDLRWPRREAGGVFLMPEEPIYYLVQRVDYAADGQTIVREATLNDGAPTLIVERDNASAPLYSDRAVADGTYGYAVRGSDLFGVLSDWGSTQQVVVRERVPPPSPQAVRANYLDPLDPWLSATDREWAEANGPGVKVSWEWPGLFSLQAPDVAEPLGEFRIYAEPGALNRLDGAVTAVTDHGATSTVATTISWQGVADALAGLTLRVGQDFFPITSHSAGDDCAFSVDNLTQPSLAPRPGACSLTVSPGHSAWVDFGRTTAWQRRAFVTAVRDAAPVVGLVVAVTDFDELSPPAPVMTRVGATRTVTVDQALTDPDGTLLPGVLLCEGMVYPAYGHTLGGAVQVHLVPQSTAASAAAAEPPVGAACTYFPGRRYEVRIGGLALTIPEDRAAIVTHVAATASDGQPEAVDDPVWSRPRRGGLGGRPGNEGAPSIPARIEAVRRTPPASLSGVPDAPDDPIYAGPANYYGQARYTLSWNAVSGVAGYAVYRCSGAALFDQDRALRQGRKGVYATGSVFADDPGFSEWLATFDPALTEAALLADVAGHFDTWRAWAERFYPALTDRQVQALAALDGNERAFRRVTPDLVMGISLVDTFDGRGQGMYIYRVRSCDAAGNLSPWPSALAFPPVHIFDVTPPATPAMIGVVGGDRHVVLRWTANREADLQEYRVWRSGDPEALTDLRRTPPTFTILPTADLVVTHVDDGLDGLQTFYYRLAAVDVAGNVSPPTTVLAARVADALPPQPPEWEESEWVRVDGTGAVFDFDDPAAADLPAAVALTWLAQSSMAEATLERRGQYERVWRAIVTLTEPVDAADTDGDGARRYAYVDTTAVLGLAQSYRVRLKDRAGKVNTRAFNETVVAPTSNGAEDTWPPT